MSLRKTNYSYLIFVVCTLICLESGFVTGEIQFKKGSPHVKLANNGTISGKLLYSREGRPINAFTGIQYATVPERFAEAQLLSKELPPTWEGVKEVVTPGPMCIQNQMVGPPVDEKSLNEECLNLNVFVPMNNTGKRGYPVMVYIHPGGFMTGNGYMFGPNFLLDEDVILVSINYRVGVFGFLSLQDATVPGNNGLKDIVVALHWIQQNIMKFSGDPRKVTIFGTSAGGAAVSYLLLSPTSKSLFSRAISQSGSALSTWAYQPNPKEIAVELATHMKCAKSSTEITSEEMLSCLRKATWQELNKAQREFKTSWPSNVASFFFSPTHEPEENKSQLTPFITKSPFAILKDSSLPISSVPWMVGVTEDEGASLFSSVVLNDEHLVNEMDSTWNELAPKAFGIDKWVPKEELLQISEKLRKFYFGSKAVSLETRDNITDVYSDSLITYGVLKAALETATKRKGKGKGVYLYQFAWQTPISIMGMFLPSDAQEIKKTGHGDDILLQFDIGKMMGGETIFIQPDSPDEEFSKNFTKLWVTFAIHGEPKYSWGNSTARKWRPISRDEVEGKVPLKLYRLDENPRQIENPYKERLAFNEQLFKEHLEAHLLKPTNAITKEKDTKKKSEL